MMYFKLAWRNIWRSPKRTWITASSIAFAVFFAIIMQSMQLGSYDRMIDNSVRFFTGHISIQDTAYWENKVLDNSINFNDLKDLSFNSSDIAVAAPKLTSFALASYKDNTKGVMINGIDPEKEALLTFLDKKLHEGNYLRKGEALIGQGLADFFNLSIGDTLVFISQGYHGVNAAGKFPVGGIVKLPLAASNNSSVYLDLSDAQYFFGADNRITSYAILLNDINIENEMKNQFQKQLPQHVIAMDWKEMMPEIIQGIEMDYIGGLIMIFILYAVIAFGIFGTFLMMTNERTYEFGILTAIGMKKRQLQLITAMEVIMLSGLGVLLGALFSLPLVSYFNFNPIKITGESAKAFEKFGYEAIVPFSLDFEVYLTQGITILIIALLLGIYPLRYIQKLKIINALRK